MIARVQLGGVWVHFGPPQAPLQPVPFYPYLLDMEVIADATGDDTASTAFVLALKAKELMGVSLRGAVQILDADGALIFQGVVARLAYTEALRVTVEA